MDDDNDDDKQRALENIHVAILFKFCNINAFNFCRFETCWPAVQRDAHGIIFVHNPSSGDHARDLELLYNYFITQTGFSHKNCVVFANQKQLADKDVKYSSKLLNTFSRVPQVPVNIEESGNRLRADFSSFIASVLGGLRDRSEQEELNIISMQSA